MKRKHGRGAGTGRVCAGAREVQSEGFSFFEAGERLFFWPSLFAYSLQPGELQQCLNSPGRGSFSFGARTSSSRADGRKIPVFLLLVEVQLGDEIFLFSAQVVSVLDFFCQKGDVSVLSAIFSKSFVGRFWFQV